ncbi:VanZ family protein [Streptomyces umbrinus]|uniref:VanZ family protein n=1 Tax=Streptomyces umbrinus TaxID=67370 RepID=UPI00167D1FF2|nr:VanZ family protein [Streptomyces umbrinus]MCR3728966.1 glycopeptide antibiotics resistance protein [Streptomyces umbrinus]MCX4563043.1 VanZ family protein [Streptomyces phaeochromogenes]GHH63896.1 VanZ family protein [Streptomyces umbrinus]
MARAVSRPRIALRLRSTSHSGTKKTGSGTKKTSPRTKKSRSPGSKSDPRPSTAPGERRPLPFVVRFLVMLIAFAAMVAFAAALAQITLQPSPASEALTHSNLHPGRSLRAYLDQPELRDAFKQIGGNLVLGIPFGVLLPVLVPKARGILRVLLLTAAVMMLVELVQGAVITGRAFDVDDVILNTSGALVGYLLLGRRLNRAVHPRKRRLKNSEA